MNTKDIYEELDMSVITFENVDIITDSDPDGLPPFGVEHLSGTEFINIQRVPCGAPFFTAFTQML